MKDQLNPLTGLRGIAAYSVLIAHSISISFLYNGANAFQPYATQIARFGMSLFFVLSGFVIYYNYAELLRIKGWIVGGYEFFVARFARLYPLYALAIFFSFSHIPSPIFINRPAALVLYITMTQTWFAFEGMLCPPAWSVSTEWFFYLFFFLFAIPIVRMRRPLLALCGFLLVVPILLHLVFQYEDQIILFLTPILREKISPSEVIDYTGWLKYFSPYIRIFEFIAGVLAAKVYMNMKSPLKNKPILAALGTLLCVSYCVGFIMHEPNHGLLVPLRANFIFAPALAPLLLLCCRYDTILSRILSSRPLTFMGEISYSVYFMQFWMLTALSSAFISTEASTEAYLNSLAKVVSIMGLTTLVAYGSYHLFERPLRSFIRWLLMFDWYRKNSEVLQGASLVRE